MKKPKKPKPGFRVPIPPPSKNHGDAKKYDRKKVKKEDPEAE
jgi:hypothetical protein